MLVAPAQTPKAVVEKLSAEVRAINAIPEVKERIAKIGLEALQSPPPDELKAFLAKDIATWGTLIKQIGLAGTL